MTNYEIRSTILVEKTSTWLLLPKHRVLLGPSKEPEDGLKLQKRRIISCCAEPKELNIIDSSTTHKS
jgi:hypothetical protein